MDIIESNIYYHSITLPEINMSRVAAVFQKLLEERSRFEWILFIVNIIFSSTFLTMFCIALIINKDLQRIVFLFVTWTLWWELPTRETQPKGRSPSLDLYALKIIFSFQVNWLECVSICSPINWFVSLSSYCFGFNCFHNNEGNYQSHRCLPGK